MRASHLPRTIDPRDIGADASRRSSPCSRSTTSMMAPVVSRMIIVNMTIVPGTACANLRAAIAPLAGGAHGQRQPARRRGEGVERGRA